MQVTSIDGVCIFGIVRRPKPRSFRRVNNLNNIFEIGGDSIGINTTFDSRDCNDLDIWNTKRGNDCECVVNSWIAIDDDFF